MDELYRYEVMKIQSLFALHNSYGIICREDQGELWTAVAIVAPFSSDLDTITRLAEKCTALQLSPDHLVDVVSDFISQVSTDT